MAVVVEVSVLPVGTGSPSISSYVASCQKILQAESAIKFQLTPMGTIIEGDLEVILNLIRRLHTVPLEAGAPRVITSIKIDERKDKKLTMAGKLAAVESKLNNKDKK